MFLEIVWFYNFHPPNHEKNISSPAQVVYSYYMDHRLGFLAEIFNGGNDTFSDTKPNTSEDICYNKDIYIHSS